MCDSMMELSARFYFNPLNSFKRGRKKHGRAKNHPRIFLNQNADIHTHTVCNQVSEPLQINRICFNVIFLEIEDRERLGENRDFNALNIKLRRCKFLFMLLSPFHCKQFFHFSDFVLIFETEKFVLSLKPKFPFSPG